MINEFLSFNLNAQLYGLGFMFITLAIASITDLKNMKIKSDFLWIWLGFTGIFFAHDYLYLSLLDLLIKWVVIILFGIVCWKGIGRIFHLARADVAAICAVSSVFSLYNILFFYLLLILTDYVAKYPLRIFGKKKSYPFLPVVWLSLILLILLLGIIKLNDVTEFIGLLW